MAEGIYFRVSGDGHGHRELALGFRRLKAERLTPEGLTTVAVTRSLALQLCRDAVPTLPRYSILNTPYSKLTLSLYWMEFARFSCFGRMMS